MKILFLADDFPPQSFGGAGISTYMLAAGMKEAGHEVSVLTTCREAQEAEAFEYEGLQVIRIALDYHPRWRFYLSLYNPPAIKKFKDLLAEINPDVVHAQNVHYYLSFATLKVAKEAGKVVLFTARDVMTFSYGKLRTKAYLKNFDCRLTWWDKILQAKKRWNPFRELLIKRYLRSADKIFAVSRALQEAMAQNGIADVEVLHTGLRVPLWHVTEEELKDFKEKHHLVGKKVVFFGGRISGAKGGSQTLQAMELIVKSIPDAVLLVVGNIDRYVLSLKQKADELGIGAGLIFTGWVGRGEIKCAYAASDVVLVPSVCLDALPRVVLEAMVSARPVVGTCYGGGPEAMIDGVTGYVVNPLQIQALAEKVVALLRDGKKAKEFGRAGYERIATHFQMKDKVSYLLGVYEKLLQEKSDHR